MTRADRLILMVITVAAFAAGALLAAVLRAGNGGDAGAAVRQAAVLVADVDFDAVDLAGAQRRFRDYRGKAVLMAIRGDDGCSDLCAQNLQLLGAALDRLDPAGAPLDVLWISPSPQRDKANASLRELAGFHPAIIGLSVERSEIERALRYLRLTDRGRSATLAFAEPAIALESLIYLFDIKGNLIQIFEPGQPVRQFLHDLASAQVKNKLF